MNLDVNTIKGQETLKDEAEAVALFHARFPTYKYVHTDKSRPAKADAVVMRNDVTDSVALTACRHDMDMAKFRGKRASEWLITKDKVDTAILLGECLCCDVLGLLYLVPSRVLLVKRIWSWPHRRVSPMRYVDDIETQATVNGGRVTRVNALIDMQNAAMCEPYERTVP